MAVMAELLPDAVVIGQVVGLMESFT